MLDPHARRKLRVPLSRPLQTSSLLWAEQSKTLSMAAVAQLVKERAVVVRVGGGATGLKEQGNMGMKHRVGPRFTRLHAVQEGSQDGDGGI